MNQKIGVAVLIVGMCLCVTDAKPTFGSLSFGLGGQQYPRGYGGYGINPYAGSYGGIGGQSYSLDPVYNNGFGSEYGSTYGSNNYGYGGLGNAYGGGGFQY